MVMAQLACINVHRLHFTPFQIARLQCYFITKCVIQITLSSVSKKYLLGTFTVL